MATCTDELMIGPPRSPAVGRDDIYLRPAQPYAVQCAEGFRTRGVQNPWPLALPLAWDADPFDDGNWCFQLHAWRMQDPILREYFRTRRAPLLREALDYSLDWQHFHDANEPTARSWYDQAAGIRALRIAFLLDRVYSGDLPVETSELEILHRLADEHAHRLQDDRFLSLTNHGLFQVFGLNLLCTVMSHRHSCRHGRAVAERFFSHLLHNQFDDQGIHREHSPAYHRFALRTIQELGALRYFDAPDLQGLLDKARQAGAWFVFPNGKVARIGDSSGGNAEPLSEAPLTKLADGRCFWIGDYTKSGYAIVRSAHKHGRSMLFVTGMANGMTHKHADDLSFELYEFGRFIFVDAGKYGYRKDHLRSYVTSAQAHNTVSILSQRIAQTDIECVGSALAPLTTDGAAFTIRGAINRPRLFRQWREITYNPGRFIVIRDRIVTQRGWTPFISSLHLAPDLTPQVQDRGFVVPLGSGRRVYGSAVGRNVAIGMVRGQKDPVGGWISTGYLEVKPTTTLRAICPGERPPIAWAIWFDDRWRNEALRSASQPLSQFGA